MKVALTTLGCKSNRYDSQVIEGLLRGEGFETVSFRDEADAYIINTCTVTSKTDYQSRQLVRRARRLNPSALLIVTGCYAQVSPGEIAGIEGVDYVVGTLERDRIPTFIKSGRKTGSPEVVTAGKRDSQPAFYSPGIKSNTMTRAYLKVQDGCDAFCSYCIIPYARGRSRSATREEVLLGLEDLMEKGFKEIVLTGIHLGGYGRDLSPASSLTALLEEMEKRDYPCRIRLSSIEPLEITDGIIALMKSSNLLCNHLHVPFQSGDDKVLSAMKRPYSRAELIGLVGKLCSSLPHISIGVDVIAGFPGESEAGFANTCDLLRELPLSYFHVFPYSRRKGTPAAELSPLENGVIKERAKVLRELGEKKKADFLNQNLGQNGEGLD